MVEHSYYDGFKNPLFKEYLERMEPRIEQYQNGARRVGIGDARLRIVPQLFVVEWDSTRLLRQAIHQQVIYAERSKTDPEKVYDQDLIDAAEVRVYGLLATIVASFPTLRARNNWSKTVKTAIEISGYSTLRQVLQRGSNIGPAPVEDYLTADPFDRELNIKPGDLPPLVKETDKPELVIKRERVIEIARTIQNAKFHRSLDGISTRHLLMMGINREEVEAIIGRGESVEKNQDEEDITFLAIYRRCLNLLSSSQ